MEGISYFVHTCTLEDHLSEGTLEIIKDGCYSELVNAKRTGLGLFNYKTFKAEFKILVRSL